MKYSGEIIAAAFIGFLVVGCSRCQDELAATKKSLERAQFELAKEKEERRTAQSDLAKTKEAFETLVALLGQRDADRRAIRTASLIGIAAQLETGPLTICVYARERYYWHWPYCGPMTEFP